MTIKLKKDIPDFHSGYESELSRLRQQLHHAGEVACRNTDTMLQQNDEIDRLRKRVAELEKCCTQRGARLQKLFGWAKGKHSAEAFIQCFPEAANWFDGDGVPTGEPL